MQTLLFLSYAGGFFILIAGVLLGLIIARTSEQRRKTKAYKRAQAQLPKATKIN